MWKKIPVTDDSLPSSLASELDGLTEQERLKVLGYLSRDRGSLLLNEHASRAFRTILEDVEHEEIDAPSEDELSTFLPLFPPRFKVS
jgi:hypothetical protein